MVRFGQISGIRGGPKGRAAFTSLRKVAAGADGGGKADARARSGDAERHARGYGRRAQSAERLRVTDAAPRLVDLDDIAGLERAWCELERVRAIRALDPRLRENILRHVDRLPPDAAAPIRAALDQMHPDAVLAAYFDTIVPPGSLGASREGAL